MLKRNEDFDKASDDDRNRLLELNTDLAVLDAQETNRLKKVSEERRTNKKDDHAKDLQDLNQQQKEILDERIKWAKGFTDFQKSKRNSRTSNGN